jgi:hypothetical protein
MSRKSGAHETLPNLSQIDQRKMLVERVATSRHMNRSARLRDMLLYVSGRVLDSEADEIHEQEVGHKVFGRQPNYDTSSYNIVRVHGSLLRKRLDQYFASEGADERIILEIPKGNYAPIFHERSEAKPASQILTEYAMEKTLRTDWPLRVAVFVSLCFAASTAFLLFRGARTSIPSSGEGNPVVRQFWSQVFSQGRATDMVLDDAAIGLFQELAGAS